jgi:hypothetical protein
MKRILLQLAASIAGGVLFALGIVGFFYMMFTLLPGLAA